MSRSTVREATALGAILAGCWLALPARAQVAGNATQQGAVATGQIVAATPQTTAGAESQSVATPSAAGPTADADTADIVVTAQKTSQTTQRVPAAVTAVTALQATKLGLTDLQRLSSVVPSLTINTIRTQASITFRGVGQTLNSPNADPQIAVNVNGAYVPTEISGVSFYDVERVEALPGPQGTLYGRNATGGVINIITKRPGSTLGAEGFVELGNYNAVHGFLAADVPLTNTLSLRGAVNVISHDGYYSNGEDDQDSTAGRLTLLWKPGPETTVTGIVAYSHDGGIGNTQQNDPAPNGQFRTLSFDPVALGYFARFNTLQASLEWDQTLGSGLSLTYVGGYNKLDAYQKNAVWAGPPPALSINSFATEETSQEARLTGDFGKLTTIVGAYYFYSRSPYTADVFPRAGLEAINGPFVSTSNGEAVFGQATYAVLDGLRVTGGLRFSRTEKKIAGINTTIAGGAASVVQYSGDGTLNQTDWRVAVEKDLGSHSLLYGSVATGFTPGGFSAASAAATSTSAVPFAPIQLTAYTLGSKNRFLDNRLTFNVEGFYYDYRNFQVSARNAITNQNNVYNAPKAEVYGAQISASFAPNPNDQLSVSISPLHAKALSLITPACNCAGYDLPYAPHLTADISYQHTFELGSGSRIVALGKARYVGGQWAFYNHPVGGYIDNYATGDADISFEPVRARWSIAVFMRNIGDTVIRTAGISGAIPGPKSYFLAAPRTFGGRLSVRLP